MRQNKITRSIILVFFIILTGAIYFKFFGPNTISKKVGLLCDSIEVGESEVIALQKLESSSFTIRKYLPHTIDPLENETVILTTDKFGPIRFNCVVKTSNGKVTAKKVTHVD